MVFLDPTKVHGITNVELEGNIVRTKPVGGFNSEGVIQYAEKVLSIAPTDQQWVLYDEVDTNAGLTPEAVDELLKQFRHFIEKNCVAIGENINPTFGGIMQRDILSKLSIPTMVAQDKNKLDAFLLHHLARSGKIIR